MESSANNDDSDDDGGIYTRLSRQLKKFAYADPCEVECITEKHHSKVPIKVLTKQCKETCQDKIENYKSAIYHE
ncbi:unnamed protein product [Rotaria sordida]|uniref:Uncharacterized protein n=3 Tax=Rotaria sordida TaxID=392033 RepID=A0A818KY40_9BILA|nr:unnamed protein product [Rotaria sordida]CAF0936587.1 unnamed protein product [Rotaria sordida]CAF3569444.1 unnamed protein product [Rotaria sordida]